MILTSIGIILIIGLFCYIAKTTVKERKRVYIEMLNKKTTVFFALAGSEDSVRIPAKREIQAIEVNAFKNKRGEYLNPDNYKHFLVHGNSMKFCGIHDGDLIFVDASFHINAYDDFPCVLLLHRNRVKTDSPKYKIRRTWIKTTYTTKENLIEEVKNIMESQDFQQIRQLELYDGDDNMISDMIDCRIPVYERGYINCKDVNDFDRNIIISTTFHTKENKIRFSVHPASLIVGRVIASFQI